MDARGHGAAGVLDGDAPEVAEAKGKGPCAWQRSVVQVVVVFCQVFEEASVIVPSVEPEQFGAGLRDIHAPLRLVAAQAFGGRPNVGAKVGVRRHRSGVDVEAVHVGVKKPLGLLALAAMHAVQVRQKIEGAEKTLVFKENISGDFACFAQRQILKAGFVHTDDPFAGAEAFDHFTEVAGQRARPVESVDAICERGGDEFVETMHYLDVRAAGRRGARGCRRCHEVVDLS